MKKTLFLIIFTLLFNINAQAIILFKNNNSVTLNQNMNYFIKKGFKIVAQDTRGIITAYVLKKDEEYVGCRTDGLSKKLTCYSVSLKDND